MSKSGWWDKNVEFILGRSVWEIYSVTQVSNGRNGHDIVVSMNWWTYFKSVCRMLAKVQNHNKVEGQSNNAHFAVWELTLSHDVIWIHHQTESTTPYIPTWRWRFPNKNKWDRSFGLKSFKVKRSDTANTLKRSRPTVPIHLMNPQSERCAHSNLLKGGRRQGNLFNHSALGKKSRREFVVAFDPVMVWEGKQFDEMRSWCSSPRRPTYKPVSSVGVLNRVSDAVGECVWWKFRVPVVVLAMVHLAPSRTCFEGVEYRLGQGMCRMRRVGGPGRPGSAHLSGVDW